MIHGKSVVVTGSTSGIGRGIGRAFAAEGTNVTLNSFGDQDAVDQERRSIEEEFGVTAIYSDADVTKPGEVADMISRSEKTFGAIDVLVNNAGIQFVAKVEDFPVEKWDAVIATNLSAAFHHFSVDRTPKTTWAHFTRVKDEKTGQFVFPFVFQFETNDASVIERLASVDGVRRVDTPAPSAGRGAWRLCCGCG